MVQNKLFQNSLAVPEPQKDVKPNQNLAKHTHIYTFRCAIWEL